MVLKLYHRVGEGVRITDRRVHQEAYIVITAIDLEKNSIACEIIGQKPAMVVNAPGIPESLAERCKFWTEFDPEDPTHVKAYYDAIDRYEIDRAVFLCYMMKNFEGITQVPSKSPKAAFGQYGYKSV